MRKFHPGNSTKRFRWQLALGTLLIAAATAGIIYPIEWQHNQRVVGNQIVVHDIIQNNSASSKPGTCAERPGPGVLTIPAIGLIAPVESGTSNAVLAVALGHDSSTSWPGAGKSSLLAGHDVGFLSQDTKLNVGDSITYTEPCATLHFVVQSHIIEKPFQNIPMPLKGGLVLDSCWPTDALWYTPQRYLVIAQYVSTTVSSPNIPGVPIPPTVPSINLPPGLLPANLTLATNPWPMGHLIINGSPSNNWSQSQAALQAEKSALELLFGLRHSISSAESTWSNALAPGVSVPKWLNGTPNSQLDVYENVKGAKLIGVTLSSSVSSNGNAVRFSMIATSDGTNLIVTSIKKLP